MSSISEHFAQQIYEVHFGTPWYGLSFRDSIPTIDPAIVFKIPKDNLNTIAQTLAHATQWRKSVSNILLGQPTELSVAHPLNWQSNDQLRAIGWETLITQSNEAAHHLIEFLKQFDDQHLNKIYISNSGNTYSFEVLIYGIIQHDVYHLGQIITMKKLLENTP